MHRLVVAAVALASAGCGTSEDDRPETLEYITVAILRPSCGNAQCHSSLRKAWGYAFDTVDAARASATDLVVPGDAENSLLYQVLVSPGGDPSINIPRMPYDQPLPNADIALIQRWIAQGAPGL